MIRQKRPIACPNIGITIYQPQLYLSLGFMKQLRLY